MMEILTMAPRPLSSFIGGELSNATITAWVKYLNSSNGVGASESANATKNISNHIKPLDLLIS